MDKGESHHDEVSVTGVKLMSLDGAKVDSENCKDEMKETVSFEKDEVQTQSHKGDNGSVLGDDSTVMSTGEDEDNDDNDDNESDCGIRDSKHAETLLIEAINLKEEGNDYFKLNDLEKAAVSYRRGVNLIKKLNMNNSGNEQVKGLLGTLQTNFSMVRFKQQKYKVSAELAGRAIKIDGENVKALYRRALAYRKMGELELARQDLKAALSVDASNTSCKKELALIKKDLEQFKEIQKKALAKAFSSKSGSFLYTDKEEIEKRRAEEVKRKKIEEQELYKKRKSEWEDECVNRLANNENVETFDEWEKRRKDEEDRRKTAEEKIRKEKEKEKKLAEKNAKKLSRERCKVEETDSDKDELSEKEVAMMRGYKKTSDGRTTSYFSREIGEEEKKRIGSIAPRRITESHPDSAMSVENQSQSGSSVWNQAKTWEEKDTTDWCKFQLRKRLLAINQKGENMTCSIISVDDLNGDASVAIAGRRKRYIFDFNLSMTYEMKDSFGKVVGSGVARIPDMCSVSHEQLEITFDSWKTHPGQEIVEHALQARTNLKEEIRKQVCLWVQDFNNQY